MLLVYRANYFLCTMIYCTVFTVIKSTLLSFKKNIYTFAVYIATCNCWKLRTYSQVIKGRAGIENTVSG